MFDFHIGTEKHNNNTIHRHKCLCLLMQMQSMKSISLPYLRSRPHVTVSSHFILNKQNFTTCGTFKNHDEVLLPPLQLVSSWRSQQLTSLRGASKSMRSHSNSFMMVWTSETIAYDLHHIELPGIPHNIGAPGRCAGNHSLLSKKSLICYIHRSTCTIFSQSDFVM